MNLLCSPLRAGPAVLGDNKVRLLAFVVLLSVLLLLTTACGGGGDDDDDGSAPASTGATGATAGGGGAAGATGSAGATGATGSAGSTAGSGGASGSAGSTGTGGGGQSLGDIAELAGLQSFRWDITMSGAGSFLGGAGVPTVPGVDTSEFTARGAYIAPDQAEVTISTAGFEFKQTIKGGQQWTTVSGVTTGPMPATSAATDLIYVSTFVDPENIVGDGTMDCGGSENVNGVQAVRCETSDEVNQQIAAGLTAGAQTSDASFLIWIAEQGNFIVRWQFEAEGTADGAPFEWSFVANITDVNNVGSIEP